MMSGIEGGIIGPMVAEAAVTATEKSSGYFDCRIARISIWPMPIASATAEPDMPEKMIEAAMLTWPSPPRQWPTRRCEKSKMRSVMPPVFMIRPARMKNGMASSGKLLTP